MLLSGIISNNSGLLATHYARAFHGSGLLWGLETVNVMYFFTSTTLMTRHQQQIVVFMQAEHGENRAELLYQLLAMGANCGDVPPLLIDLMEI